MRRLAVTALVLGILVVGAPVAEGAFPGKNGLIAFTRGFEAPTDIYSIAPDGSGLRQLTESAGFDRHPAWSPDGRKIAFASNRGGSFFEFDIHVMDADGSNQTRLTSVPLEDSAPAWSPDGERIAFQSSRDGNLEIYVMNDDGSAQTRLTDSAFLDVDPAWSPDGSRIAFERRNPDTGSSVILTMTPTGADVQQLSPGSSPDWSPDGQRIALDGVFTINAADGSDPRQVIGETLPIPLFHSEPAWSPAGDLIAYTFTACNRDSCGSALRTIRPDGTGLTQLASSARDGPSWQPIPEPSPGDFKNSSKYCKALREFLGDGLFRPRHGSHGGCVSAQH